MAKFFNDQAGMDNLAAHLEGAKAKMPADIRSAHARCSKHPEEVLSGEVSGVFIAAQHSRRLKLQSGSDGGQTAMGPRCGSDSVLGSASGLPISKEFLEEMNRYWF